MDVPDSVASQSDSDLVWAGFGPLLTAWLLKTSVGLRSPCLQALSMRHTERDRETEIQRDTERHT